MQLLPKGTGRHVLVEQRVDDVLRLAGAIVRSQ